MANAHIVVLSAACLGLLCLPCVVAVLLHDDRSVLRPSALTRQVLARIRARRSNQRRILDKPTGPRELLRRAARAGTVLRRARPDDNQPRHPEVAALRGRNALPRPTARPHRHGPSHPRMTGGKVAADGASGRPAPPQRDRRRRESDPLIRLDHDLCDIDIAAILASLPDPSIEQLAHELRRLDRRRRGGTYGSQRWLDGVLKAYDLRLCLACRCLDIAQRLEPLEGLDRELERVRMESELEAAGLTLH